MKLVVLSGCAVLTLASAMFGSFAVADETGIATALHSVRREKGRLCMTEHFHNGESSGQRTRRQAEIVAIQSWTAYTDFEYGSDWARWSRSASKRMSCRLKSDGWGCSIESRPCK